MIYSLLHQCTLQCEFCTLWQTPVHEQRFLPLQDVLQDLRDSKASRASTLHLGGGDPLIYPELMPLLKALRPRFRGIWLYTPGILYEAQAEVLRPYVDELCLVFNHPNSDDNNRIAGTAHTKLLISAVKQAQAVGQPVRLVLLTHCESALFLPEAEELAQSLQVLLELRPVHQYLGEKLTPETMTFIRRYGRVKNVTVWPGELKAHLRPLQCSGLPRSNQGWIERVWRQLNQI